MSEQKTDPGLGAPTIPDAPPSTEPTLPEDRVGMARYTTDPRVVISPEREVLRGLRAEPTPLTGLRDLVQDVHDLQEAKKLREAALEQAKVEHAAEAPTVPRPRSAARNGDTARMEPRIIDETPAVERSPSRVEITSPGERARTRVGTRQLLGVAALCALIGVVFVYVITRGGSGSASGVTGPSATASASVSPPSSATSATTLSSAASALPSGGTADTTATSVVAPPPSAPEPTAPSAKHAAPSKTGTAATANPGAQNTASTTAPTQPAATAPTTPPTPVSVAPGPTASAPNIWKIKEH